MEPVLDSHFVYYGIPHWRLLRRERGLHCYYPSELYWDMDQRRYLYAQHLRTRRFVLQRGRRLLDHKTNELYGYMDLGRHLYAQHLRTGRIVLCRERGLFDHKAGQLHGYMASGTVMHPQSVPSAHRRLLLFGWNMPDIGVRPVQQSRRNASGRRHKLQPQPLCSPPKRPLRRRDAG